MKTPSSFFLPHEAATVLLAQRIAYYIQQLANGGNFPPFRLYLSGDLGAGKTCFSRALLQALGVKGRIKSPSYALLESYKVEQLDLYHFDFYRFSEPEEWFEAGFEDEFFQPNRLVLAEWPEKVGALLPPATLHLHLHYQDEGRMVHISTSTPEGQACLATLAPLATLT